MNRIVQDKKIAIVGLDDGNNETKIVLIDSVNGIESDQIRANTFKTSVAFGELSVLKSDGDGIENAGDIYYHNQVPYTVLNKGNTSNSDVLDPRTVDYHNSVQNVIMVQHALKKLGVDETYDVYLTTGLPFNDFYKNTSNGSNRDMKTEKIKSFNENWNKLTCRDGKRPPNLVSHYVYAEGVASYINGLYDVRSGLIKDSIINEKNREMPIAVVDLGGRTLDIVTINPDGDGFSSKESTTVDIGALDLYEAIANDIKSEFRIKHVLPSGVEKSIKEKTYSVFGEKKDISNIIDKNLSMFAERVKLEIRKVLKDGVDLGIILFVGGGSLLIREYLKDMYPSILWDKNAQFSNALGLLKTNIYLLNRDNEELKSYFPNLANSINNNG